MLYIRNSDYDDGIVQYLSFKFENSKETIDKNTTAAPILKFPGDEAGPSS